jgi:hypothetical protein
MKQLEIFGADAGRKLSLALLLAVFGLSFTFGALGIDFGEHWDQRKIVKTVTTTYQTGILLPGWYNYPSLSYKLMMLASLPDAAAVVLSDRGITPQLVDIEYAADGVLSISEKVQEVLKSSAFPLRARLFFLFVTLLTGFWTYALARQLGAARWAALFSAALLFSSWEFAYHARWIAPDGLLTQFGILTLLLVMLSLSASGYKRLVWLFLSAVAAGLTCGAKYYGGMFLLPVLLAAFAYIRQQKLSYRELALLGSGLLVVFAATFLISTPGALVEPMRFYKDVSFEVYHYGNGHFGYTVQAGMEHFTRYMTYLIFAGFSPYPPLALLAFLLAMVGVYGLLKQRQGWWPVILFLFIPVLHIGYMSQQKVLFVRNSLIVLPFVAILAAQGITFLWQWRPLSGPAGRVVMGILAVGLLAVNFTWQYNAAQSIQNRGQVDFRANLSAYIQSYPKVSFYLSPQAQELVEDLSFPNVVADPQQAEKFVYFSRETNNLLANRFGLYEPPYGPYEVNLNYYPSWDGDSRLVVIKLQDALNQKRIRALIEGTEP